MSVRTAAGHDETNVTGHGTVDKPPFLSKNSSSEARD